MLDVRFFLGSKVDLSFIGRDRGNVTHPDLIGGSGHKLLFASIVYHDKGVFPIFRSTIGQVSEYNYLVSLSLVLETPKQHKIMLGKNRVKEYA